MLDKNKIKNKMVGKAPAKKSDMVDLICPNCNKEISYYKGKKISCSDCNILLKIKE